MSEDEEGVGSLVEGKVVITDLLGLGKAAEKLTPAVTEIIKAIGAGAGKVYEPASIYLNERAKGAADRQNALADAKAFLDLKTRSPAVLEAMRDRILGTEYRRQENIVAAETEALQIAQNDATEAVRKVEPDFMAEWTEGVKDVSDEMVRSYWAHLLAAAPMSKNGRIDKPIVDFLKLLDQQLCRDLQHYYSTAYCTNGVFFAGLDSQNSMAQEIGLGIYTQRQSIETLDRTLRIVANSGTLGVFQIGERASRLCEIAFDEVDEEGSFRAFYTDLPNTLNWLAFGQSKAELIFEVTDARSNRHYFDLDYVGSEMVHARRPNAGLIQDLDFNGYLGGDELRASLSSIARCLNYRGAKRVARIPF